MKIKVLDFTRLPMDSFDGREMSFRCQLLDGDQILKNFMVYVTVTGSVFPNWTEPLDPNYTKGDLGFLTLKIIEEDLKQAVRNGDFENEIKLEYSSYNNPNIEVDLTNIEDITGYEITL